MTKPPKKNIRRTPKAAAGKKTSANVARSAPSGSKLDAIVGALRTPKGATITHLMKLTGWQAHSVRGALAGALKKRGHTIGSAKTGDERVYRIETRK